MENFSIVIAYCLLWVTITLQSFLFWMPFFGVIFRHTKIPAYATILCSVAMSVLTAVLFSFVAQGAFQTNEPIQLVRVAVTCLIEGFFVVLLLYCFDASAMRKFCDLVSVGDEAEPAVFDSELMRRLPFELQGEILELKASDKLTIVVTSVGEFPVRLSMTEAIDEFDSAKGIRIHRSHWVHKRILQKLFFENGNPKVMLSSGSVRPIGRTMVDEVKRVLSLH